MADPGNAMAFSNLPKPVGGNIMARKFGEIAEDENCLEC